MKYCRNCLIPDTRPNGKFNSQGICIPCQFSMQSKSVEYEERLSELKSIVRKFTYRNRKKRWQCIVGVSGGKDSTRQALWVREKLGINPLLVSVVYPPRHINQIGTENISNLINLGFDTYVIGPAPRLSRELLKESFFRFGNLMKATEMALTSGVPRVAIQKKINLILWGENMALQVGDQGALGESIWDANNLINSNTISGGDLSWYRSVVDNDSLLPMYKYPSLKEMKDNKVQTIFLGPAWPDWSAYSNSRLSISYGFNIRGGDPYKTGDIHGTSMVDEDWFIVNMLLKFYKFGFSRGTEEANDAIRAGKISREEGVEIAEKYDEGCDDIYINSLCKYIDITVDEFWENIKKFANPNLFDLSNQRPKKLFKVGYGLDQ